MNWFSILVVFVIAWWMILFVVLPIGVQSQSEAGRTEEGTEPGAPVQHNLPKKAKWATLGAIIVTVLAYLINLSGIIPVPQPQW